MQFRQVCSICLFLCLGFAATAVAQSIDFTPPVNPGTTINITGTTSTVSVFTVDSKDAKCDATDITTMTKNELALKSAVGAQAPFQFAFDADHPQPLTLAKAVNAGTALCLVAFVDSTKPFYSSKPQVVSGSTPAKTNISADSANPPTPLAQSVSVKGTKADSVSVYAFSTDYKPLSITVDDNGNKLCTFGDLGGRQATLATDIVLTSGDAQSIPLSAPLSAGLQLCLVQHVAGGAPEYSYFATVAAASSGLLQFTGELVTGSSSFSIEGPTDKEAVSVYLFGAGYQGYKPHVSGENDTERPCQDSDRAYGTELTMVGTGSAPATTNTAPITSANSPVTITLSNPLAAGTLICLFGSPEAGGKTNEFSSFKRVQYFAPGEDYGRFAINLTGGVMVSNEQQSSSSSSASQYFDVGFFYTLMRPDAETKAKYNWYNEHGPGLATLMHIRLTTVPVAATTNTSTTSTPSLSTSLNVLSSQQSATVLMGFYFPFRLTHWYGRTNWVTAAPLFYGGFNTLLNPTTTTTSSTSSTVTVTTTAFSSVYNFHAAGVRFGWDIYPKRTDEAPLEFSWISLALGWYSNLPSWQCTVLASASTISGYTPPASAKYVMEQSTPTTSCYVTPMPSSSSVPPYTVYESRKLVPRVDIAGELSLPSYPVVFGYDANLGQYGKWFGGDGIDSLNKPGNDVRFYFGLKFNITKALAKLGVPTQ